MKKLTLLLFGLHRTTQSNKLTLLLRGLRRTTREMKKLTLLLCGLQRTSIGVNAAAEQYKHRNDLLSVKTHITWVVNLSRVTVWDAGAWVALEIFH